jgi:hypothetical protein
MFVFLDLLGRVSSICFAWILLRESKSSNALAIVSIITSFLGFLKYFGQWSYRLRKLLFSFDPSDYVPENLGRRDYFSLTLKHSSLSVSTGVKSSCHGRFSRRCIKICSRFTTVLFISSLLFGVAFVSVSRAFALFSFCCSAVFFTTLWKHEVYKKNSVKLAQADMLKALRNPMSRKYLFLADEKVRNLLEGELIFRGTASAFWDFLLELLFGIVLIFASVPIITVQRLQMSLLFVAIVLAVRLVFVMSVRCLCFRKEPPSREEVKCGFQSKFLIY